MDAATQGPNTATPTTRPSDTADVRALVRYFDDQSFNRSNLAVVDEMVGEDFDNHDPIPGQPLGKDGIKVAIQTLKGAFPDWHLEQELVIGDGDVAGHRILWTGTFTNDFMGFKAHGGKVSVRSHDFNRFRDGKLVERWCVFDNLSFVDQLEGGDPQGVREVGAKAYAAFKLWAETGEVEPFLGFLADDATLVFAPAPAPHNTLQTGKAAIERYLRFFGDELKLRVKHEAKPGMVNGRSYAVELVATGELEGAVRAVKLLTVLDIADGKVTGLREYGGGPA